MKLIISKNRTIRELKQEFNEQYPFLKLEFYKPDGVNFIQTRTRLTDSTSLETAGLRDNGELELRNEMSVAELEGVFHSLFGLNAQVSRKLGMFWLETTMTDAWSLKKQNDHGREISLPVKKSIPGFDNREDELPDVQ